MPEAPVHKTTFPSRGKLGALGLVVNVIVPWNTIYMQAALEQLRAEDYPTFGSVASRAPTLMQRYQISY
jgi:Tn3 transposase DDE domain